MILRQETLQIDGGEIPITLTQDGGNFSVAVDGVEWLSINNPVHATVLFQMMADHLLEYMRYKHN